jgi:hypothetical protein
VNALRQLQRFAASVIRAWFGLTVDEQRGAALLLALLILGVAVRLWHICLRG